MIPEDAEDAEEDGLVAVSPGIAIVTREKLAYPTRRTGCGWDAGSPGTPGRVLTRALDLPSHRPGLDIAVVAFGTVESGPAGRRVNARYPPRRSLNRSGTHAGGPLPLEESHRSHIPPETSSVVEAVIVAFAVGFGEVGIIPLAIVWDASEEGWEHGGERSRFQKDGSSEGNLGREPLVGVLCAIFFGL